MIRYKIICLVILILVTVKYCLCQTDQLTVSVSNPGGPGTLHFENPKGGIRVIGYEGNTVLVSAKLRFNNEPDRNVAGFKKIDQHTFNLSAEESNNQVTIFCRSENKTIDVEIKVPKRFALAVKVMDNGNIEVLNIEGELEVENPNGDISIDGCSGSAVLNTVNGRITASYRKISAQGTFMFTSLDGNIELSVPDNVGITFKMKSQHGEILSAFDLKPVEKQTIIKNSDKGKLYSLEDWTKGTINGGGLLFVLNSYNGDIILKKSLKVM